MDPTEWAAEWAANVAVSDGHQRVEARSRMAESAGEGYGGQDEERSGEEGWLRRTREGLVNRDGVLAKAGRQGPTGRRDQRGG